MRTICLSLCAALVIATAAPFSARADPAKFTIDSDHSSVLFRVDHLGYSKVVGMFLGFGGNFVIDEADLAASQVAFVIESGSVFTRQKKRDNHLRSPDFFNAVEFEQIRFQSTGVELRTARAGKLTGNLTLLGVKRLVTFDVTLNRVAPHPDPRKKVIVAGFSARGTVKRSDFGMTYGAPGIGDEIEIQLEIEGESPIPGG
jgi:polyisoprenoid-binding protein YceI